MGIDELAVPAQSPTLLQALMAGIPYALVMMLPGIGGLWFGPKALRNGDGGGQIPSAVGGSRRCDRAASASRPDCSDAY